MPQNHDWVEKARNAQSEVNRWLTDSSQKVTLRPQIRQKLLNLKRAYVQEYINMHSRARLGVNEDERKRSLMEDERLKALKALSTIELMPRQHLTDFQNRLATLRPCFSLTEQDLEASPVCPHCDFRPATENSGVSAKVILDHMDAELDNLVDSWTQTLLSNLDDPTTRGNLDLLKPDQRKLVDTFLKERRLPEELTPDFIQTLKEVLSGLVKVVVKTDELRGALLKGGSPATPAELKKRFEEYLGEITRGHEPGKVRVVLE
jgi:hypothetical protein